MASVGPLSDSAVDAIASAIFAKLVPRVVEAYSKPDQEPLEFATASLLASYIKLQITHPRGLAFVYLLYSDMGGSLMRKTIFLDPIQCPGQTLRYTWDGWGLIAVQLHGSEYCRMSRICSNSEKRAHAWAPTIPEWDPPDTWNWKAVERHTRRLQRVLRKVA